MHKKHIFLRVFSKITIFACVFCVFSACADTTTCDIDYTPVTGNSIQKGTPTPTTPVAIESVGTKVGNKYQISVVAQGKNLLDTSNSNLTYWGASSGRLSYYSDGSRHSYIIDMEKAGLKSGDTITASCESRGTVSYWSIGVYEKIAQDEIQLYYINVAAPDKTATFTIPDNAKYIVVFNGTGFATNQQLEKGSTATSYVPYSTPITTPIYLNAPLRKVGNYADVLDYKKGQIIRNVGVKVLDGTESWYAFWEHGYISSLTDMLPGNTLDGMCNYFRNSSQDGVRFGSGDNELIFNQVVSTLNVPTVGDWKSWLAEQYAAGTPVTIYYPLATPVVEQIENWSCTPPITDIKIATTKMVDDEFAAAEAKLATTVQTIESVVSRTITQTGQIQILQDTKQTRPDENCPANMKCLLVQDEDGTPHWYPIIEP